MNNKIVIFLLTIICSSLFSGCDYPDDPIYDRYGNEVEFEQLRKERRMSYELIRRNTMDDY